jgi:serine/threonine protein phosphatase PrpC
LDANDKFMIMACDGLWDDLSSEKSVEIVSGLMNEGYKENYATALFKAALSGAEQGGPLNDIDRIQHHLSIPPPLCRRYRDDMTINVLFFDGVQVKKDGVALNEVVPLVEPSSPQLEAWVKFLSDRIFSKL